MKKLHVLLLAVCLGAGQLQAQNTTETFANKDNAVSVGFGIGGVYGIGDYSTQTPVFGAQYERGILELKMGGVIGVGGFIGYKGYAYQGSSGPWSFKEKYNIVIVGARGNFHYDVFKVPKLDTYGGTMIAYHIVNQNLEYDGPGNPYYSEHSNALYASLYVGGRYYFSPQFAGFAELGYGVSWLTMGITYKF